MVSWILGGVPGLQRWSAVVVSLQHKHACYKICKCKFFFSSSCTLITQLLWSLHRGIWAQKHLRVTENGPGTQLETTTRSLPQTTTKWISNWNTLATHGQIIYKVTEMLSGQGGWGWFRREPKLQPLRSISWWWGWRRCRKPSHTIQRQEEAKRGPSDTEKGSQAPGKDQEGHSSCG